MRNFVLLGIVFLTFVQCSYNKIDEVDYVCYYDDAFTKVKIRGKLINQLEQGIWYYYDESGRLAQTGIYKNGLPIGEWIYNFEQLKDTILWEQKEFVGEIYFSLPREFNSTRYKDTEESFTAVDTTTNDVFTIHLRNRILLDSMSDVFSQNYELFKENYKIVEASSNVVSGEGFEYYLDSYLLHHKLRNQVVSLFMIYKKIGNQLIILSYASNPANKDRAKLLLGEVFHHLWINKERLANPLTGVTVPSKK